MRREKTLVPVFAGLFAVGCFVVAENKLSIIGETFVLVVGFSRARCLFVRCWLGCRESCWWLESAAYKVAFHRVPFRAILCRGEPNCVAREIVDVSVGSGGCRYALRSPSHLFADIPCFQHPFCLIDITGFHLEISSVQGPSWCLAIILASFQKILLCPRIHDEVPFICCPQVICLVALCSRPMFPVRLLARRLELRRKRVCCLRRVQDGHPTDGSVVRW